MTNRDSARNFSADELQRHVRGRVRAAIRPQLAQLRDMEAEHKHKARTERMRRHYRMFDETDTEVDAHAAREALRAAGQAIGNGVQTIYETLSASMNAMWDGLRAAFTTTQDDYALSFPVPAAEHAAADHTRRQYLTETRHAAHRAANN